MKPKLIPMLVGAIALTVAATPFVVKAQANPSGQLLVAQAQRHNLFTDLNLTQRQKDQIEQIRKDMHSQLKSVFTPKQLEQLKAARSNHQGRQQAIAAMNLTQQQKTQLRQIKQSTKSKMEAILTPTQQRQLQQKLQERREQRQQQNY